MVINKTTPQKSTSAESDGFFLSKSQHHLVLLLFIQADDMFRPFLGHPQVTR